MIDTNTAAATSASRNHWSPNERDPAVARSRPEPLQRLITLKDRFDVAFACDTDHDRHGIVTRGAGLMPPNHCPSVAFDHLFLHRPQWSATAAVGKTMVSSAMIDRVANRLGRSLFEAPVGFKWFAPGLFDGRHRAQVLRLCGPRRALRTRRRDHRALGRGSVVAVCARDRATVASVLSGRLSTSHWRILLQVQLQFELFGRARSDGHAGWTSPYHFGINLGPVVLMCENHRSDLLWRLMRAHRSCVCPTSAFPIPAPVIVVPGSFLAVLFAAEQTATAGRPMLAFFSRKKCCPARTGDIMKPSLAIFAATMSPLANCMSHCAHPRNTEEANTSTASIPADV